jgi:mono/diheme cytochrome c family protein
MSAVRTLSAGMVCILCLACLGCAGAPGRPATGPEVPRPEQVMDFATLYKQNCAGCHGANGTNGAAMSLANPVYLAFAGEPIVRRVTANGVAGKLMPGFAGSAGGTLTDRQIDSLVEGIFHVWGRPNALAASQAPSYTGTQLNSGQGRKTFAEFCARCHGADGKGRKGTTDDPNAVAGSIVDPSYLALVSDQSLRSTIVAGRPDQGMPDWRSDATGPGAHAMTDQEIGDTVAWLAAQRAQYPGQPYVSQK